MYEVNIKFSTLNKSLLIPNYTYGTRINIPNVPINYKNLTIRR